MSRAILDISMSLDGFITASGQTAEDPMGQDDAGSGGQTLHAWARDLGDEAAEAAIPDIQRLDVFGAIICGRRTHETSLPWWGADGPSGKLRPPVVVLAHGEGDQPPEDGVYETVATAADALRRAEELAGGRDVTVIGGANMAQAFLAEGLLDEIKIHLVPVIFGSGTRLLAGLPAHVHLEQMDAEPRSSATHLRYRVMASSSEGS